MPAVPKKPAKPEEIQIEFREGYTPSRRQLAAIKRLRKEIFRHAVEMDVPYTLLVIEDRNPNTSDEKDIGGNFGTGVTWGGSLFFTANLHTTLCAIKDCVPLEGAIKHEAGHMVIDNTETRTQLEYLARIMETVHDSNDGSQYGHHRSDGTIQQAVKKLEVLVENNPAWFSASPEKLARLMENNDVCYIQFKKDMAEHLPSAQELFDLKNEIENGARENCIGGRSTDKKMLENSPCIDMQLLAKLQEFIVTFYKGEEYVADGIARRYSQSPDLMERFLVWYGEHSPGGKYPENDGIIHPSMHRRIERMRHVTQHGEPPADKKLRPEIAPEDKLRFLDTILSGSTDMPASKDGQNR